MQYLLATPLLLASSCFGQVHAGDIILTISPAGAIQTNDINGSNQFVPTRVFGATFGEFPNFTNDPGFDSPDGTFASQSQIGFRIRRALRAWNGTEFPSAVIPGERIQVRLGPLGPTLTPTTDTPVTGFSIAANSSGKYHHHLGYTLLAAPGNAQPQDGVYLFEVELFSNQSSVQPSLPFWLVFNQNRTSQEHQVAIDWVSTNLLCVADFNADGTVDFFDYLDFVAAFSSSESSADFNSDGTIDFFDYLDFVAAFSQGCG